MTISTTPRATAPTETPSGHDRRWWALLVIATGQLMIVLDATIVNIALPTIQTDLGISGADRQWVVTAYTLAFAGLLLLGGRVGDYTGRKRAFLIALGGFAVASAVGGASTGLAMLLVARAAQGAFGALLFPTALSLLSTTFSDSGERAKAFAVFGAVAGGGSAIGLTLGGVLVEFLSWHWVFYVNVPLAIVTAAGAVLCLTDGRTRERPRFDLLGAVLVSGGLTALVYGLGEAASSGWSATGTFLPLLGGAVLLVLFVVVEARGNHPLLPLRIVTDRIRGSAFLAQMLAMVGLFGMFFFLSFYLQHVEAYTPVEAGIAFLPMTGGVLIGSALTSRVMTRVPPRFPLGTGLLLAAAGMAWLTRLGMESGYASLILPALLVTGLGLGAIFPTAANVATSGVTPRDSGVASAALNASQQIGASLGTALLNSVAVAQSAAFLATLADPTEHDRQASLVAGYTTATAWGAGILAAAGLALLVMARSRDATGPAPGASDPG